MTGNNEAIRIKLLSIKEHYHLNRQELSDVIGAHTAASQIQQWENGDEEIPERYALKIRDFPLSPPFSDESFGAARFTQIDLFAGIGGIRQAFARCGGKTVFSSEKDPFAVRTYTANYGDIPAGDITKIDVVDIPDHDVLLAGFPCQPFSSAGRKKGFEDTRGTMFFEIARILRGKRPKAFMLENVKQLYHHDGGKTLDVILNVLYELDYYVPYPQVLDARKFGCPQHRERLIFVGFNRDYLSAQYEEFKYPTGQEYPNMKIKDILENDVDDIYTISNIAYQGHLARKKQNSDKGWGFGANIFSPEDSSTSTISARYYKDGAEALISQDNANPRRLMPRECARLQGFPEDFIIPVSDSRAYRQFGNSVCIPMIEAVATKIVDYMENMTGF